MKVRNIILMVVSLFSTLAFAGGSGGGTVLPTAMKFWDSKEVVRYLGEFDGSVYFQYGERINGDWIIEELTVPNHEIILDQPAYRAIKKSKSSGDWWGISEVYDN